MDPLKILISSTCYDLKETRESLRSSLSSIGYDVTISERDDILYDPREHTHVNCVKAISECDVVVFIIGDRFGGAAVKNALDIANLEKLETSSVDFFSKERNLNISISQCEILSAIANDIPVYTFIKNEVHTYHNLYEKNKSKKELSKIEIPGFRNPTEFKYIFEFYNFLRKGKRGNYCKPFTTADEIVTVLKKQLSGLLARLIKETKSDVLVNNDLEILSATVVGHESTERQKAFNRLYLNLNKEDTIKIMGTGVTSFLSDEERVRGYLRDGHDIQVLMVNNNVIKDGLHCTSNIFLRNINKSSKNKSFSLTPQGTKVDCYLADSNFLIDKNHFNKYHHRPKYNENVRSSIKLVKEYQKDKELKKYKGKITARLFRSFTPFSITAIAKQGRKKNDLIAEFIIPFTKNRILFHSNNTEDPTVFKLFMEFFDSTWKNSTDLT